MDWVSRPGPLITRVEVFIGDKSDVSSGRLANLTIKGIEKYIHILKKHTGNLQNQII